MGVERRATVLHHHQQDDDEPTVTCAEFGSFVRGAVQQIRPEAEAVIRWLDDLEKLADELEARGDTVYQSESSAGDLISVMAIHLPNELRAVARNLWNLCELLRLPLTADGER
jgi:hypothetical protein